MAWCGGFAKRAAAVASVMKIKLWEQIEAGIEDEEMREWLNDASVDGLLSQPKLMLVSALTLMAVHKAAGKRMLQMFPNLDADLYSWLDEDGGFGALNEQPRLMALSAITLVGIVNDEKEQEMKTEVETADVNGAWRAFLWSLAGEAGKLLIEKMDLPPFITEELFKAIDALGDMEMPQTSNQEGADDDTPDLLVVEVTPAETSDDEEKSRPSKPRHQSSKHRHNSGAEHHDDGHSEHHRHHSKGHHRHHSKEHHGHHSKKHHRHHSKDHPSKDLPSDET